MQKSLKTRDKLDALSVFPFGKPLSLHTSPSGDLLALVSGTSGESLFTHLISSWSPREMNHFTFTTPLTFHFPHSSPPRSHWG